MSVETTKEERDRARETHVIIVEILNIQTKQSTMRKWKFDVKDIFPPETHFLMQTTMSPEVLPVSFEVGKRYQVPILFNKSGQVGNLDGQQYELIQEWIEGSVSDVPEEEQATLEDISIPLIPSSDKKVELIPKPDVFDNDVDIKSGGNFVLLDKNKGSQLAAKPTMYDNLVKHELNIESIIEYLCPTATKQEAFKFLQLCSNQGLDPFVGDAYLIKWGNKAQMVVSKDAFLKKAESLGDYEGFEAGIVIHVNENNVFEYRTGSMKLSNEDMVGGWARVFRKNMKPFYNEVSFTEYTTGKNLWLTKPATMIRKVALVQAMREAFPASFQGMYDRSEMGEVSAEEVQ